jgi:hypothetical protein
MGDSLPALAVPALAPTIVQVVCASAHTCVLDNAGAIACWGDNDDGELGIGSAAAVTSSTAATVVDLGTPPTRSPTPPTTTASPVTTLSPVKSAGVRLSAWVVVTILAPQLLLFVLW